MKTEEFVGRTEELACLLELAEEAAEGTCRVALVSGELGVGKSALLDRFQERLEVDLSRLGFQTARANCYPDVAYQPILTLIESLIRNAPSPSFRENVVPALRAVAPDLLSLIPGVGPALKTVTSSAITAGRVLTNAETAAFAAVTDNMFAQGLSALRKVATAGAPLALLIDSAHDLDFSSSAILQEFISGETEVPVLVVLAYRDQELSPDHPLRKTVQRIRPGRRTALPLRGLSPPDIETYLQRRYGSSLAPGFVRWLAELSNGLPLFIEEYLPLLENDGIIVGQLDARLDSDIEPRVRVWQRGDPDPLPRFASAFEVLQERVDRLEARDRDLLARCALSGPPALSWVVARLGEYDEEQVLDALAQIAAREDTIRPASRDEWVTALTDLSDVYEFVHLLMHETLYQVLRSPTLRSRLHERTATLLEELADDLSSSGIELPSSLQLLIAEHYRRANRFVQATHRELEVARRLIARGAPTEALTLSSRALESLRDLADTPHRLIAEAAIVILTAAEVKQPPIRDASTGIDLEVVAAEAVTAADASEDPDLRVQSRYLRGTIALRARGLDEGIRCLREALTEARAADGRANEFAVLSSLGHHLMSRSPDEGAQVLLEAARVYDLIDRDGLDKDGLRRLGAERDLLEARLGVRDFDLGSYGSALEYLRRSVTGLKTAGFVHDLGWPTNFLGQLLVAIGAYEEAELTLKEHLQLAEGGIPRAAGAANRALLGKLYLELERISDARALLHEALEEAETVGDQNVVPIVRNYLAEALLSEPRDPDGLRECRTLLQATLQETEVSGFERSRAQALCLRSSLSLHEGDRVGAQADITAALQLVRAAGALPTVRTEELLHVDFTVQLADGHPERARTSLEEAAAVLRSKAESLPDGHYRDSFLNRVRVSQAIIAAARLHGLEDLLELTGPDRQAASNRVASS